MLEKISFITPTRIARRLAGPAGFLLVAAAAATASAGNIHVEGATARLSDDRTNGHRIEVYMKISNAGGVDRLYAVRSDLSRETMLSVVGAMHDGGEGAGHGGMTMMESKHHQTAALELRTGETISLKPGSAHIMLMNPVRTPPDGATFPVTLFFERAGRVTVDVTMKSADPAGQLTR